MTAAPPAAPAATPPPAAEAGTFKWGDFFGFRYMITPILIQVIYMIGAVFITIAGILAFFAPASGGLSPVLAGLLIILLGNLAWRVYAELVILLFKIFGSLQAIERRGDT